MLALRRLQPGSVAACSFYSLVASQRGQALLPTSIVIDTWDYAICQPVWLILIKTLRNAVTSVGSHVEEAQSRHPAHASQPLSYEIIESTLVHGLVHFALVALELDFGLAAERLHRIAPVCQLELFEEHVVQRAQIKLDGFCINCRRLRDGFFYFREPDPNPVDGRDRLARNCGRPRIFANRIGLRQPVASIIKLGLASFQEVQQLFGRE